MSAKKKVTFSVFTKSWKRMSASALGKFVSGLGFDGIELPVRDGYQVEPANVARDLPRIARQLADYGIKITSVAAPVDEVTMAACAEAGVPIIRICVGLFENQDYLEREIQLWKEYDALVPLLDKHGVTLGVQNHCGRCVCNAMGLRHLVERYDPKHIGVVWDAGHTALNGEEPEMAIDIIWSHLRMVNLKNAIWTRTNGPEADHALWKDYWTTGRHGLASWPRVAVELKRRQYKGVVCLSAEYNDEASVDRLIAEDIAFAKSLFY